jgi:hypothetical protein
VAGSSAFLLGLAAPEAILPVDASEIPTGEKHRTSGAYLAGGFLTADASLGAFTGDAEKEVCATLAGCLIHPRRPIRTDHDRFHDYLREFFLNGFYCHCEFSAKWNERNPN